MSTAMYPRPIEGSAALVPAQHVARVASPGFVRRRGTLQQGHALEVLGHAVEYLIDCGMFDPHSGNGAGNREAVHILMGLSRSVFAECPEVPTLRQRAAKMLLRMQRRSV